MKKHSSFFDVDDNLKEKKARKEDDGDAVLISTMAKMIKESMTVFWEFLHTDKDTTNLFLTIILQGSKAHLQDPADSELFMDIKAIHQKVCIFFIFVQSPIRQLHSVHSKRQTFCCFF